MSKVFEVLSKAREQGIDIFSDEVNDFIYKLLLQERAVRLEKENTELKKKLKIAPPKGTTVRDKKTGQMGYSKGETCGMSGCLPVHILKGDGYTHHFEDWEEIEVKIK